MNYTKAQSDFLVYCIEMYKQQFGLTGSQTQSLFAECAADKYILDDYEALHTTGLEYLMNDIQGFIENHARSRLHSNL